MVRELFEMARAKKACLIFFDEIDAIGGARFDDGQGGDNEVQRTMLELINQLDGFDPRGNIKVCDDWSEEAFMLQVLMATNRPDTLDPALVRPGRLDRRVEFSLPDLDGRTHIFKIHAKQMSVDREIRYDLLARLCPNTTGLSLYSQTLLYCGPCVQALKFVRYALNPACSLSDPAVKWPPRRTSLMPFRRLSRATRSSAALHAT
jgi:26S proteasome regulatory subunit T1